MHCSGLSLDLIRRLIWLDRRSNNTHSCHHSMLSSIESLYPYSTVPSNWKPHWRFGHDSEEMSICVFMAKVFPLNFPENFWAQCRQQPHGPQKIPKIHTIRRVLILCLVIARVFHFAKERLSFLDFGWSIQQRCNVHSKFSFFSPLSLVPFLLASFFAFLAFLKQSFMKPLKKKQTLRNSRQASPRLASKFFGGPFFSQHHTVASLADRRLKNTAWRKETS